MDVQPKRPTTKGPAEWFTGDVWLDPVAQPDGSPEDTVASVHFSPGARTAWHRHAGGQTLVVTEGEGRAQSRGEPLAVIRSGDVVRTPGDEWHWHGAAPDRFMTHLAVTHGAAEWGEQVTEREYLGENT